MKFPAPIFLVLLAAALTGCPAGSGQDAVGPAADGRPASSSPVVHEVVKPPMDETSGQVPDEMNDQTSATPSEPDAKQTPADDSPETQPSDGQDAENEPPSIFSLKMGDSVVSIGDWDDNVDLEAIFGPPVHQEIVRLEHADTFSGSFLKKLEYDGLAIDLFSPQDNGKTFWILRMKVSREGIPTSAGIEVGLTLEEALAAYPGMEKTTAGERIPGHERYRIYSESQYEYIDVVVRDGVVTGIDISGSL